MALQLAGRDCLVDTDGKTWRYAEVDAAAAELAGRLVAAGAGPEDVVALRMPRSANLVVGMLAVLKAGAAFLVVDPEWPAERTNHVLGSGGARAMVGPLLEVELLEPAGHPPEEAERSADPSAGAEPPRQLAYVVATSGSTGTPKLVQVERRSLAATVDAYIRHFDLGSADRGSFLGSVSFDAIICEVWPLLCAGGTLFVAPDEVRRVPSRLLEWISEHALSFVWLPTPTLELLLAQEPRVGLQVPSLRVLKTAGEQLRIWPAKDLGCPLFNCYGPAEATVIATAGVVDPRQRRSSLPSIGAALSSCRIQVLDADLRPVERGQVGMLHIGGATVARGYRGQPGVTGERFLPDPFSEQAGARMYATGDLCRELEDATLEFIGRADTQVKIRGARVELGEIEAHLLTAPRVTGAAAVYVPSDAGARLVAFAVTNGVETGPSAELLAHLRAGLPAYMVPAQVHVVPALELGPNGKTDRRFLARLARRWQQEATLPAAGCDASDPTARAFAEVLGLPAVDPAASFFDLGGDSISAVLLLERLRRDLGLAVPYREFLSSPSVGAVRARLEEPGAEDSAVVQRGLSREEPVPLTGTQRLIWYQTMLHPSATAYHARAMILFEGEIDADALRQALQWVVEQHEIFRTSFFTDEEDVWQVVHDPWRVSLPEASLVHVDPERFADECAHLMGTMDAPFRLGELPLVRWLYVRGPSSRSALLQVEHHMVHDGWSFNLLLEDLFRSYAKIRQGETPELREDQLQCADFAVAETRWLSSPEADRQREFWEAALSGGDLVIRPLDLLASGGDGPGGSLRRMLPRETWQRVEALGRRYGTTPFAVLMGCLAIVLKPYAGATRLIIGTAAANRNRSGSTRIIGPLLNSLAVPLSVDGERTFAGHLEGVAESVARSLSNQELPYLSLVESVRPERTRSDNPLFQVFLGFHDSPPPAVELPGARWQVLEALGGGSAKFDLSLIVIPRPGQLGDGDPVHCVWEHRSDALPLDMLERLVRSFDFVLEQALQNPERPLATIDSVHPMDRRALLADLAGRADEEPLPPPVVEQVLRRIEAMGPGEAVVTDRERLTYAELGERVAGLVERLESELSADSPTLALCLPRSVDLVAAILAVHAASGVFVPLDPAYPPPRLAFLAADAAVDAVIHAPGHPEPPLPPEIHRIEVGSGPRASLPAALRARSPRPDEPAYVIYTSGSTGRPKGVVVTQGGLSNALAGMGAVLGVRPGDRWLAVTTVAFDIAQLDLLLPLVCGATVVIAPKDAMTDAGALMDWIAREGISHMQATPSTWKMLVFAGWRPRPGFVVVSGGEALPVDLAHELVAAGAVVFNMYGPTETTIYSTVYRVTGAESREIPIGRPIRNTVALVMDEVGRPVPVGAPGELWLGGSGVALGYHNLPAETADRFLREGHQCGDLVLPGPLYRTGDRVRYLPDGNLSFLGRGDGQVKIRGHRVELGEVECALRALDEVLDAVAVLDTDANLDTRLLAYVVADQPIDPQRIRSELRARLPEFLVPGKILRIDRVPRTLNGKVDRSALPSSGSEEPEDAAVPVPPRNETERVILEILQDLLQSRELGVFDNFFQAGGHSLLAIRYAIRLKARFGVELSLLDVVECPTVAALAGRIASAQARDTSRHDQAIPEISIEI